MTANAASKRVSVTTWALQLLLGLMMAGGGIAKLTGDPAMVQLFDDIGAGQWLRTVIGVLEIAGGMGQLVPRLRALAALGLLLLLSGASVVNIAVLHANPLAAMALAALAACVLWLRRHELPDFRSTQRTRSAYS